MMKNNKEIYLKCFPDVLESYFYFFLIFFDIHYRKQVPLSGTSVHLMALKQNLFNKEKNRVSYRTKRIMLLAKTKRIMFLAIYLIRSDIICKVPLSK